MGRVTSKRLTVPTERGWKIQLRDLKFFAWKNVIHIFFLFWKNFVWSHDVMKLITLLIGIFILFACCLLVPLFLGTIWMPAVKKVVFVAVKNKLSLTDVGLCFISWTYSSCVCWKMTVIFIILLPVINLCHLVTELQVSAFPAIWLSSFDLDTRKV